MIRKKGEFQLSKIEKFVKLIRAGDAMKTNSGWLIKSQKVSPKVHKLLRLANREILYIKE